MSDSSGADASPAIQHVAEADLPSGYAGSMLRVHAFRGDSGVEHLAMVKRPFTSPPLVRLHSECLTGDALGSQRCDCGAQLQEALRLIGESGGVLIYLRGHEGRGIGLANKIRAYALQDQGYDTAQANTELGLSQDTREYGMAALMLKFFALYDIALLTNNPDKVTALQRFGITVSRRQPLLIPANPQNVNYLATKRDKFGHLIPR